MRQPNFIIS
jgi:hypothetical protein